MGLTISSPSLNALQKAWLHTRQRTTETDESNRLPDDFLDFAEQCLVIQNKADELVPFIPNAVQRDLYHKITTSDSRFHLIIKPRQVGSSTFITALIGYEAWRKPTRAVTMAHDSDTTAKLRRMGKLFFENLPPGLGIQRDIDNAATTVYLPHHSEITIATAGGDRSKKQGGKGRGGTYNFFHGSEVAYWPDPKKTIGGALQGLTKNGLCVFETTANGAQGWTWETVNSPGKWMIHFYAWYWEPEYRLPVDEPLTYTENEQQLIDRAAREGFEITPEQIAWRRDKQEELGNEFSQEYPETLHEAFLVSGKSFFGNVEHVYSAPLDVIPDPNEEYIGGLDFAQSGDYTTQIILNRRTLEMVDFLHINNLKWQDMRCQIANMAHKWNHAQIIGEANSMGSTNIELLQSGEYDEEGNLLYTGIELIPFDTTPKSKPPLIRGLYHGLHEGGITVQPIPVIQSEIRSFVSRQTGSGHWQYEGSDGAHDDCVIALALAWHGVNSHIVMDYFFA